MVAARFAVFTNAFSVEIRGTPVLRLAKRSRKKAILHSGDRLGTERAWNQTSLTRSARISTRFLIDPHT